MSFRKLLSSDQLVGSFYISSFCLILLGCFMRNCNFPKFGLTPGFIANVYIILSLLELFQISLSVNLNCFRNALTKSLLFYFFIVKCAFPIFVSACVLLHGSNFKVTFTISVSFCLNYLRVCMETLTLPVPIPDEEKKLT